MYPSTWQILIVLGVLLLFFGQKKIREFGKSLGESLRDFKKGLEENSEKKDSLQEAKSSIPEKTNLNSPENSSSHKNQS